MSDPMQQLNSKVTRSKSSQFTELQCVSLYAHHTEDKRLRSLKITDDDELIVRDNLQSLQTKVVTTDHELPAGYVTVSHIQELEANRDISILAEADIHINSLNIDVEVSNDNSNYYTLDGHYITEHTSGLSKQIVLAGFKSKYFRLSVSNTHGSGSIIFSTSYTY